MVLENCEDINAVYANNWSSDLQYHREIKRDQTWPQIPLHSWDT